MSACPRCCVCGLNGDRTHGCCLHDSDPADYDAPPPVVEVDEVTARLLGMEW